MQEGLQSRCFGSAFVGGTSVPMLYGRIANAGRKSIGTEVPPTKAAAAGLQSRGRAQSRLDGSKCFCNPAQHAW
ncbi:DUF6053 domain-containing protein [Lysobacter enzymogenes]|uniref:DUF6053 domain-containing protein n=1 Tax=Lysobacter enzymogenes TaxID=69 RepID=UPI003D18C020